MDAQPMDAKDREPAAADTETDVEGHSIFAAIASSGVLRARSPRDGQAGRSKADEDLPPLTKRFPSMSDDRRK